MITFINNSGQEVEVNDSLANVAAAEKAGWTRKKKAKPAKSTKKEA